MESGEFPSSENYFQSITSLEQPPSPPSVAKKKKKNKNNNNYNQRRFSDEQIKLLESMFESETKLEPRKKIQLARELGLQPRQVAIWFQNRRARWKSKQIEQDFKNLRAQYDSLVSQFESLKEEKESLALQLQKLKDLLLSKPNDEIKEDKDFEEEKYRNTNSKGETKTSLEEGLEDRGGGVLMTTTTTNNIENLGQQGYEHLSTNQQQVDSSLTSLESWYSRSDLIGILDQSHGCSQWLSFWS